MYGLARMAMCLARCRHWGWNPTQDTIDWLLHNEYFPRSRTDTVITGDKRLTDEYYRIIDRLTKGEAP